MEAQHDLEAAQLALHAQNTYDIRREAHRSGKGADTKSDAWNQRGIVGATEELEDLRE